MSDLDGDYILHVLRNPWGHDDEMPRVRLAAADAIECLAKRAHALFTALDAYGTHAKDCQKWADVPCTCGLDDALRGGTEHTPDMKDAGLPK